MNSIVPTNRNELPRAIAKEKNGIVLYWIEELGIAGIHQRGIARMLNCASESIASAIEAVNFTQFIEAEIVTPGGVQGVNLISETDLAKLLRHIARSKAKPETRDRALDSLEKLAAAGFKLMVMLELAPTELVARANEHLEMMKLHNENLKLQVQLSTVQDSMLTMHGREVVLLLAGKSDAIVREEIRVTEVIDLATNNTIVFLSADQLKAEVYKRSGQKLKTQKQFIDALHKAGRDDLLVPVTRPATAEYVIPDRLDEAIEIVFGKCRQKLIGEKV